MRKPLDKNDAHKNVSSASRCQSGANFRFCSLAQSDKCAIYKDGDVAEWLKAAVC